MAVFTVAAAVDRFLAVSVGENRSSESASSKLPLPNRSCDNLETALGFLELVLGLASALEGNSNGRFSLKLRLDRVAENHSEGV